MIHSGRQAFFVNEGGHIGLWFVSGSRSSAALDDFKGGSLTISSVANPAADTTPKRLYLPLVVKH
ncbi:MAG: hypothetical protein KDI79_17560 [Anaerolineae bacterium]|nr:hypothetical protein [Anaerolineae bacterium]